MDLMLLGTSKEARSHFQSGFMEHPYTKIYFASSPVTKGVLHAQETVVETWHTTLVDNWKPSKQEEKSHQATSNAAEKDAAEESSEESTKDDETSGVDSGGCNDGKRT
jgi:23S rRNA-/tRNA-specific pseudouridylate synthase